MTEKSLDRRKLLSFLEKESESLRKIALKALEGDKIADRFLSFNGEANGYTQIFFKVKRGDFDA